MSNEAHRVQNIDVVLPVVKGAIAESMAINERQIRPDDKLFGPDSLDLDSLDILDVIFRTEKALKMAVTMGSQRKILLKMRPDVAEDHQFDTSDFPDATVQSLSEATARSLQEYMES